MIFTLIGVGTLGFFLFILQQFLYKHMWQEKLNVDISFAADHIFEGESGELKETIENRKALPLSVLKVKFMTDRHLVFPNEKGSRTTDHYYRNDVFSINGKERIIRTLKYKAGRRGYYTIQEMNLVSSDLFFMTQLVADRKVDTEVYVYPKPYSSRSLQRVLISLNGEVLSRRHLLEDPFEYRGIREYQPYDDMRSINWKATARTGDIKVNQRNYTSLKSVRIFFNMQEDDIMKKEDSQELTLRITAALCSFFLKQGMRVSCYGNGGDILTGQPVSIESCSGTGQLDFIYRTLARVNTDLPPISFCQAFAQTVLEEEDGALTCFVAPAQYEDFVELLLRYRRAHGPFAWFYPVSAGNRRPQLPPQLAGLIHVIYPDA